MPTKKKSKLATKKKYAWKKLKNKEDVKTEFVTLSVFDDKREAKDDVTKAAVTFNETECTNVSNITLKQSSSCLCKSGLQEDFSDTAKPHLNETVASCGTDLQQGMPLGKKSKLSTQYVGRKRKHIREKKTVIDDKREAKDDVAVAFNEKDGTNVSDFTLKQSSSCNVNITDSLRPNGRLEKQKSKRHSQFNKNRGLDEQSYNSCLKDDYLHTVKTHLNETVASCGTYLQQGMPPGKKSKLSTQYKRRKRRKRRKRKHDEVKKTVIDDKREAENGVTKTAVAANETECSNVSLIKHEHPSSCYGRIRDSLGLSSRLKQQKDKRDAQLKIKRGLDGQLCESSFEDDFSQTVEAFIEETDFKELDDYVHEPWIGKNLNRLLQLSQEKDFNEPDTEIIPSGSIDEQSTTLTNEEMSDFKCVECMPVTEPKSKIDEVRPKVSFTPNLISPSTESALGVDFASYARCEPANKYKQTNADSRFPEYYQNQNLDFFNIKGYVRSIQTTNETEIGQRSCVLQRNDTPFHQYTQSQVFSVPPRVINVFECSFVFESHNLSIYNYNDFESNSNNINSTSNFPMTSLANPEKAANYKKENKESKVEMNQTKCSKTTTEALNSKLRCTKTGPDESLPRGPGNLPCFPKLFD